MKYSKNISLNGTSLFLSSKAKLPGVIYYPDNSLSVKLKKVSFQTI